MQEFFDAVAIHALFENGYRNLKKNMTAINDLNVFPVPDGDTGLNMVKTFAGGLAAVSDDALSVTEYLERLSRAVLLSARGNSGVIFSQFVSGLNRGLKGKDKIAFSDFAPAFLCAKEDAYKAITLPTEGTILTVIREASEFLSENAEKYEDFHSGMTALLNEMKISLAKTPDLLPVLKEAGVVDSGGAGLVCFFEGICAYLSGQDVEDSPELDGTIGATANITGANFGPDSVLEYGYCTEFILQLMNYKTDLSKFNLEAFTEPLKAMGDSIVSVENVGIVKIHIHTFTPEKVLEYARNFGEFVTLKIENMSVQHSEIEKKAEPKEKLKYAIVTVASGKGTCEYFYSIGANAVIDGGQTNNPSVDAFLEAFDRFDAEYIIVLPNNSNIILTAKQASEIYKNADVRVIDTKSIVEGYSALSMMDIWSENVEDIVESMQEAKENVTTAYVTTATRDTVMDGVEIEKGKYIGIENKTIKVCTEDKLECAKKTVKSVTDECEKDVIIVFSGASVSEAEIENLRNFLESNYPLCDVGFVDGGQEVYDFIISLE